MNKVHVKTGDTVVVINGKNRGRKGKVMQVSPAEDKVIVEGVNVVTKHVKPKKMGEQGGLVKAESALYASKVQLVCPKCGAATRVGHPKVANNNGKTVSSNVDFYSGFVYEMIGLPQEIFTPLFAMARIVGWCAHRNEELNFEGKRIIRPAYKNVLEEVAYIPIKKR